MTDDLENKVNSPAERKEVPNEEFRRVVDQIAEHLHCRGSNLHPAYRVIRTSVPSRIVPSILVIKFFYATGRDVPIHLYEAAQKALEKIEQTPKEVLIEPRKTKRKQKPLPEPKKTYDVPEGHVAHFVLDALVEEAQKIYGKKQQIDDSLAIRGYIKKTELLTAIKKQEHCPAEVYEGLVKLLLEKENITLPEGALPQMRKPTQYSVEDFYILGQLVKFGDTTGVVVEKIPKNKIRVVQDDGKSKIYVEGTYDDPQHTRPKKDYIW